MIQHVQSWTPRSSALTGATGTETGTETAQGSLLVAVGNIRAADTNLALTDNGGNTWALLGSYDHGAGDGYLFACANANPITEITTTVTNAADEPTAANHMVTLHEFSGGPTTLAGVADTLASLAADDTTVGPALATPPEPGSLAFSAALAAVSNRTYTLQGGAFTSLPEFRSGQMTIGAAWAIADDTTPLGAQWTTDTAPGGGTLTVAIPPGDGPPPEPEELAFASATGGNPVGGTTLEVISDDDDDTVVWSGDNPDGEQWDPWVLPPIEPPAGDFTAPFRTTSTGGSGTIAFEISGDGETWTPGPTIVADGAPTDRDVVFPAAALTGITEQQWATGVQIRLTLTVG